ncbi:glycosyltransferase [Tessaracoccus sp. MC1865]|uniref:glycosyltransferase family 2 protein n=1 Tax=Tessaracoccus sp. MC1865 TaxID=2760310 RepID=UPI0016034948|nr:glycosyltransferase [Tessaracoccus sp. MC1865]MBB1482826.1 glycosyltransferase [Tessaracoccus sp. MC1865]QTO37734.1 glycosyltransferase [Tessaracoccus sp. MC1865]
MTSVTLIIPTRHRARFLGATVRALQASAAEAMRGTKRQVRILVVDDASEDDETRHVANYLGADYVRVPEHDGRNDPGAAIKLGTARVDTEFQSLFGDDDIALIRHLPTAFQRLEDQAIDVVSNSFHIVDANLQVTNSVVLKPTGLADITQGRTALNDGSFVRHDLIRDFEFDLSLEAHMLPPMWTKLMLDEARFSIIEEPTWLYRRHDGNLSNSAMSERDRELRRRSNEVVRAMVAARLGSIQGEAPVAESASRREDNVTIEKDPSSVTSPETPAAPSEVAPQLDDPSTVPPRGLRYRALNKLARVLKSLSDRAVQASRRI